MSEANYCTLKYCTVFITNMTSFHINGIPGCSGCACDCQGHIISTASTERQHYFLRKLLAGERTVPLVFVGPSGTGKSAVVAEWMRLRLPRDRYLSHRLTLSAQTSAEQLQDALFDKLERRRKGTLLTVWYTSNSRTLVEHRLVGVEPEHELSTCRAQSIA